MRHKAFLLAFIVLLAVCLAGALLPGCRLRRTLTATPALSEGERPSLTNSPSPGVQTGAISGYALFYVAQTPVYVPGANIIIQGTKTYSLTADAGGRYAQAGLDPSTYAVWARIPDRYSDWVIVEIQAGAETMQDIEMSNLVLPTMTVKP